MKKRVHLICLLMILTIIGIGMISDRNRVLHLRIGTDGELSLLLSADSVSQMIHPWFNELDGKYYFFLPAFCGTDTVYIDETDRFDLQLNGVKQRKGGCFSFWEKDVYKMSLFDSDELEVSYDVMFMRSANIPAVFIETESKNMEKIHGNKEYEESGNICVIQESGVVDYRGKLEKLTGRGNTTWSYNKKSYTFDLYEKETLCGLDESKKWNLLAIFREGTRMGTKIVMDMADYMGLDYTVSSTWVDLYLNGEYVGNYLLSEPVMVGDNAVDIYDLEEENRRNNPDFDMAATYDEGNKKGYELEDVRTVNGGFLIEKDVSQYYVNEKSGFVTNQGMCFSVKAPAHASREQIAYISNYIQHLENLMITRDKEYLNYIDLDSFAKRFLIDEISLNFDANKTSMYFYLDKDDPILYAGPVWDYDTAMGECNSGWAEGGQVNYERSNIGLSGTDILEWNNVLYEQPEFYEHMCENFTALLPFMEYMLEEGIDLYAERVKSSSNMDDIRWINEDVYNDYPGNYQAYDNNVRHLKYYLINRLNVLIEKWGIAHDDFEFIGNGEQHTVNFMINDTIIETRLVQDGEILQDLPVLDEERYWGWYYTYSQEKCRPHLPVFEDCTFYPKEK